MTHLPKNNMEFDHIILVAQLRVATSLCVKDISEAMLSAPLTVGFMSVVKKAMTENIAGAECVSVARRVCVFPL